MGEEIAKRVAKDGTQRGMTQGSKRRESLTQQIKDAVYKDSGIRDWDPIVMLSIIAARSYTGFPAVDHDGRAILDEDGRQVIIPPDYAMSAAASSKVAPYIHSILRPKDVAAEEQDQSSAMAERRERIAQAFNKMGIEVEYHDKKPKRAKKEQDDG